MTDLIRDVNFDKKVIIAPKFHKDKADVTTHEATGISETKTDKGIFESPSLNPAVSAS